MMGGAEYNNAFAKFLKYDLEDVWKPTWRNSTERTRRFRERQRELQTPEDGEQSEDTKKAADGSGRKPAKKSKRKKSSDTTDKEELTDTSDRETTDEEHDCSDSSSTRSPSAKAPLDKTTETVKTNKDRAVVKSPTHIQKPSTKQAPPANINATSSSSGIAGLKPRISVRNVKDLMPASKDNPEPPPISLILQPHSNHPTLQSLSPIDNRIQGKSKRDSVEIIRLPSTNDNGTVQPPINNNRQATSNGSIQTPPVHATFQSPTDGHCQVSMNDNHQPVAIDKMLKELSAQGILKSVCVNNGNPNSPVCTTLHPLNNNNVLPPIKENLQLQPINSIPQWLPPPINGNSQPSPIRGIIQVRINGQTKAPANSNIQAPINNNLQLQPTNAILQRISVKRPHQPPPLSGNPQPPSIRGIIQVPINGNLQPPASSNLETPTNSNLQNPSVRGTNQPSINDNLPPPFSHKDKLRSRTYVKIKPKISRNLQPSPTAQLTTPKEVVQPLVNNVTLHEEKQVDLSTCDEHAIYGVYVAKELRNCGRNKIERKIACELIDNILVSLRTGAYEEAAVTIKEISVNSKILNWCTNSPTKEIEIVEDEPAL